MIDIYHSDCMIKMQELIENNTQVDSVVTDAPYHLQSIVDRFGKENSAPAKFGTDGAFSRASKHFMGKSWDGGDIAQNSEMWKLCLQLLKPGGHLVAFSSSKTYHRMACAIEDAGFEIRDQLMWLYGVGLPKSHDVGKQLAKKEHPRADELTGFGTAIKPCHEPIVLARKPLAEKTVAENVLKYGTGALNIDATRLEGGRFPPNVMHDGSKEVENAFSEFGNVSKFFYSGKASASERSKGLDEKNPHPTVKTISVMSWLCKMVTPPNGTILDPFVGSGSTGIAAKINGFGFIGIDMEEEYCEVAKKRIEAWDE